MIDNTKEQNGNGNNRYSNWDWTKRDVDLASENNLTRERIRQIRRSLGKPKSPFHKRQGVALEVNQNKEFWLNTPIPEIAKLTGLKYHTVYSRKARLLRDTESTQKQEEKIVQE